jgi:hypothetical protein
MGEAETTTSIASRPDIDPDAHIALKVDSVLATAVAPKNGGPGEIKVLPPSRTKDRSNNLWLVLIGVSICLLNMGAAWYLIILSNGFVVTGLVTGVPSATDKALTLIPTADANELIVLDRIVQSDVNHRNLANKQIAVTVAMAASFCLVAIGFALFVMGVEAAYAISGSSPTGGLVIQATSPGLLCFILAAVVVCFALARHSEVTYPPLAVSQGDEQESPQDTGPLPTPVQLKPNYSEKAASK